MNAKLDHKLLGKIYLHYKKYPWAAAEFEKVTISYFYVIVDCFYLYKHLNISDGDNVSTEIKDTESILLLAEIKLEIVIDDF